MMKRPLVMIGGLLALVVLGVGAWILISPLFINETVDEPFPFEAPSAAEIAQMSEAEVQATRDALMGALPSEAEITQMSEEQRMAMEQEVVEMMSTLPADQVEEPMPAAGPTLLTQGQFQDADNFHQGSGDALVFALPDGSYVLRFENFETTNGPDLRVLLAAGSPNPSDHDELGEYVDLGTLKGNMGNQNYEIPADADVSQFQSVVIYCRTFGVVFSTAALS